MQALTILHLQTKNNSNGNPRRIYLVLQGSEVLHAFDEGYGGFPSNELHKRGYRRRGNGPGDARDRYTAADVACQIDVTPGEYSCWKRSEFWIPS